MVPRDLRAMADQPTDQFGTAREVYPGATVDGHYIPGLARAVAAKAGVKTPAEQVPIIWHGIARAEPGHPEAAILHAIFRRRRRPPSRGWFRGKVVLIGSDVTLVDRHRTPFSVFFSGDAGELAGHRDPGPCPVPVPASQAFAGGGLANQFCHHPGAGAAGAALAVVSASLWIRAIGVLLLVPLFWAGGVALYHYANVMVGLLSPALAMTVSFFSMEALSGREARQQKAFIQGAFSRYVSPAIVDRMVADPSSMNLEGERREMTFLFSDIADFTTMSEQIDAIQLAHVLNNYLDGMTNLV